MTAFEENQQIGPKVFWNPTIELPVHEHTCQACGVKTIERPTCTVITRPVENLLHLLCGDPAVFHCAGKCKRSFCSFHAYNTGGYCPECWPLKYPDGALRDR